MQQPPWFSQTYSSHYAQAYANQLAPATTPQGYTFSSTYNPPVQQNVPSTSSAVWYHPGNSRCTYKTCTFQGSPQTVETHMMDRHLIYPQGWERRKKKPEWDTDPSLKGWVPSKPIPIQGTTIILDTPEVLEAWIAERKQRWPTAARVEDKKRKMDEAVARGQLSLEDSGFAARRKRRRTDEGANDGERQNARGRGRGVGRARGRGRGTDAGWSGRGRSGALVPRPRVDTKTPATESSSDSENSSGDDDDDEPEVVFSKPSFVQGDAPKLEGDLTAEAVVAAQNDLPQPNASVGPLEVKKKPRPLQPKQPPRNPFASRPTLLRNLLLPEIRITVSNLSQAIRFLVDNDFLQDVELRPGQANQKLIEVLNEAPS
ncbi:hypothetical protein B0H10DRAFT_2225366 [Mycena sp. CBHHK59/15]|nr:hypothetical protein B0H10DRAFT_2225366 [Mycena sp. CBHHK59/15]